MARPAFQSCVVTSGFGVNRSDKALVDPGVGVLSGGGSEEAARGRSRGNQAPEGTVR